MSAGTPLSYRFGPFLLLEGSGELWRQQTRIPLTPKEFDLLLYLVRNRGRLVRKEDLLDAVWAGTHVEEGSLSRVISTLRTALGDSTRSPNYIETVPRRGYRFVADVIPADSLPRESGRASVATAAGDSIAILPLNNETGDPTFDYLSDGISEAVINKLASLRRLRVVPRSSSFRYKKSDLTVHEIAHRLSVRLVLSGRMSSERDHLVFSAELIDARADTQLWGERYYRQPEEMIGLSETLALDIAERVSLQLSSEEKREVSASPTKNHQAYQFYLKGRYALNRLTRESVQTAARYFQEAIDRDPDYALAYVGLADSYLMFATKGPAQATLPKARTAALRALQIDGSLPEAYASLAMVEFNSFRWAEAEKNFRRSIDLNPEYALARDWYSMYLVTMGRMEDALVQIRYAHQLDPLSPVINADVAAIELMSGDIAKGIADLEQLIQLEPKLPLAHQWLAFGYLRAGRFDDAIRQAQKDVEVSDQATLSLANLAYICHAAGRQSEANAAAEEVLKRQASTPPIEIAGAYVAMGDDDRAVEWLERGVTERVGTMTYITWPPWFDHLHHDPRYIDLLRRMDMRT